MLNFLLFVALFVVSVSAYTFSYTSNGIANTFAAFDFTYAQNAVISDPYGGQAYFGEKLFYFIAEDYFATNLQKYNVSEWNIDLSFKSGSMRRDGYVMRADLMLDCRFNGKYRYNAKKAFEIREGKAI